MQNVFWTSTASRQTRGRVARRPAGCRARPPRRRRRARAPRSARARPRRRGPGRSARGPGARAWREPTLVLQNGRGDRAGRRRAVRLLRASAGRVGGRAHHRARRRAARPSCRRLRSAPWRTAWCTGARTGCEAAYDELAEAYAEIGANVDRLGVAGRRRRRPLPREPRARARRPAAGAWSHDLTASSARRPTRLPDWTAERRRRGRGPAERPRLRVRHRLLHTRACAELPGDGDLTSTSRVRRRRAGRMPPDDRRRRRQLGPGVRGRRARRRAAAASRGKLLRHALADAAERGIETSTLVVHGARLSGLRASSATGRSSRSSMWQRAGARLIRRPRRSPRT